jgi:hypothetical protein
MEPTTGLLVVFAKCNKPADEAAWSEWYDDVHLPDLLGDGNGPAVATRWELARKPEPGMPGIGFSHVTIYEFSGGDVTAQAERLVTLDGELRAEGRIHGSHAVIDAGMFVAHGQWNRKPPPSEALRGHILAFVLANDPTLEAEWDAWYDREHVPDMLDSGAFAAATRWRREPRARFGANHVTLYDVTLPSVDEAVALSAAVMPGIVAAGRKHRAHTGAMTVTLVPSGRYGGAGYRP